MESSTTVRVPDAIPPKSNPPTSGAQSVETASPGSNNTEQEKVTPPRVSDKFSQLVSQANSLNSAGKLLEAKLLYEEALLLKPDDNWCVTQLKAIDIKVMADKEKNAKTEDENAYQSRVKSGNQSFQQGNISSAKAHYQLALQIRANDAYVLKQLNAIELISKDEQFRKLVKTGRDAFAAKEFDSAESNFNQALILKSGDPVVIAELKKIGTAREALNRKDDLKERNEMFNFKLASADSLFNLKSYDNARGLYGETILLKPGNTHIKSQLSKIVLLKKKDRDLAKLDSINRVRYEKEIIRGDRAMETKDFNTARTAFNLAKKLQPNESLPSEKLDRIQEIQKMIVDEKKLSQLNKRSADSINKKYNTLIIQAQAANKKEDYKTAKDFFGQALLLKPEEKVPVVQIKILDSIFEVRANQSRYTRFIIIADSITRVGMEYPKALSIYDSALLIKPNDRYALSRKRYVNDEILRRDSELMKYTDHEMRTFRFNQALPTYKDAEKARSDGKFPEAYTGFINFLHEIDTLNLKYYLSTQLPYINKAMVYVKDLEQYKPIPPVVVPSDERKKRPRRKKTKNSS